MTAIPREWAATGEWREELLPPDTTVRPINLDTWCGAVAPHTFSVLVCTRLPGHTGRHAAGTGWRIIAVWGDRP